MATEKQLRANRENAKKSTGPKSDSGKQKVSKNALRHGITSFNEVVWGESKEELRALRDEFVEEYHPETVTEWTLVEVAVQAIWKVRRALRAENKKYTSSPFDIYGEKVDPFAGTDIITLNRYHTANLNSYYRAIAKLQQKTLDS